MAAQDDASLKHAIVVALRSTIKEHGPITAERMVGAAKRIIVQLTSLRGDGRRALGGQRFGGTGTAEMKRRAALRRRDG